MGAGFSPANPMPRILQIARSVTGGLRRYLEVLLRTLRESGAEVHLAASPIPEDRFRTFVRSQEAAGVVFHPIPMSRPFWPWADLRATAAIFRILRAGRFDAVHTHAAKAGLVGRLASAVARVPVVFHTPHGLRTNEPGLVGTAARLIERIGSPFTTRLVAVSDGERDLAIRSGIDPRKILVARNGIPSPAVASTGEEGLRSKVQGPTSAESLTSDLRLSTLDLRPAPSDCLFGSAGRFCRQKSFGRLVEAAGILSRRGGRARFVLAGEGPLESDLRAAAGREDLAGRFEFLPWQADVPAFLSGLDAFALPSRFEGLPFSLLESMAAGVPPVASDIPGVSEVVEDGRSGLLVPSQDPAALADALGRLEREPALRRSLGEGARRRVADWFREDGMIADLRRAYSNVLG